MTTNGYQTATPEGMAAYRAPSLLQPHRARQAIRDAHTGKIPILTGFFHGVSSPGMAKIVAQLGYDMVWIDWEHSSCSVETMTQMVHDTSLVSEGRTMPFVRIPGHDHAAMGYALDAGASIVVPQVDTVEQAKALISYKKFGAHNGGSRSAPPMRLFPGISDKAIDPSRSIWENLNDQAALIIQIESLEAINNLDAILTECGKDIDAVWIGALDARVSMGLSFEMGVPQNEPEWLEAMAIYEETLRKHDMPSSGLAIGDIDSVVAKAAETKCIVFFYGDVIGLFAGMADLMKVKQWAPRNYSAANKRLK